MQPELERLPRRRGAGDPGEAKHAGLAVEQRDELHVPDRRGRPSPRATGASARALRPAEQTHGQRRRDRQPPPRRARAPRCPRAEPRATAAARRAAPRRAPQPRRRRRRERTGVERREGGLPARDLGREGGVVRRRARRRPPPRSGPSSRSTYSAASAASSGSSGQSSGGIGGRAHASRHFRSVISARRSQVRMVLSGTLEGSAPAPRSCVLPDRRRAPPAPGPREAGRGSPRSAAVVGRCGAGLGSRAGIGEVDHVGDVARRRPAQPQPVDRGIAGDRQDPAWPLPRPERNWPALCQILTNASWVASSASPRFARIRRATPKSFGAARS